jgi:acetyltransferase-like isoleucine patch superfamily enzyme
MEKNNLIKIYDNVEIGKNVEIEEFCIIGKPPRGKTNGELKTVIGDNSVIRSGTVIYAGNIIGENFNTGHNVVIREENKIGANVSIGTLSCIEHHIVIEDGVRIHSQVFIPEYTTIKKNAWIGPNVVVTNAKYPRSKNVKDNLIGAIIEEDAKIGANVTTLPGVKIGKNALVGSGSLVNKDVKEKEVVVGNPIKKIKEIKDIKEYNE